MTLVNYDDINSYDDDLDVVLSLTTMDGIRMQIYIGVEYKIHHMHRSPVCLPTQICIHSQEV